MRTAADNRGREKEEFLAAWQEMVQWFFGHGIIGCAMRGSAIGGSLVDYLKSFEELETSIDTAGDDKGLSGRDHKRGIKSGWAGTSSRKPGVNEVLVPPSVGDGVAVEIFISQLVGSFDPRGPTEGLYDQIITNSFDV